MKRKIISSLLIAIILVLLSLIYKTESQTKPPNGYINNGNTTTHGYATEPLLPIPQRGFPIYYVSGTPDGISFSDYYNNINIKNLIIDYSIYSLLTFAVISFYDFIRKKS